MHKGVILLTVAESREEARTKAESFMAEYHEQVCDWYQVGGRWSGTLDGYDPKKDPKNLSTCEYCNGTGDRKDLEPPEWKEECGGCNACHGTGKQIAWPTAYGEHEGDIIELSRCINKVKEWQQDPEATGAAEQKEAEERYGKDGEHPNLGMYGWSLKCAGNLYAQNFCFDCNIFNTENYDYSLPDDLKGWWAVMIDMHS